KFVRRRRRMVVAALVVLVSIAAGMVGTVTQARRAQALAAQAQLERDNALRQLSYAESSNEFITFLLDQTGPDKAFTTSELLARAREAAQAASDVALQTLIDCAIAWQTNERGSPDVALAMLDASVARLRGASAGDPDRATLAECLFARGQVQFVRSDHVA